jgi:hypothetical protein
MQRLLLPFAVGFLAALAATMSFSVLAAGRAAAVQFPPADSTSAPAEEAEGEMSSVSSGADDVVLSRTPVGRVSASEPPEASARGGSAAAAPQAAPARLTSDESAGAALTIRRDSAGVVIERRLARTFGAMSAKDAARVMEQMSDADINTLLGHLNERQAAGILANISPERAARLGERTLRGSEGS